MAKYCEKCKQEWPDNFMVCPICGGDLTVKDVTEPRINVKLGDGNAVSGGINLVDSHAVDSHDVHNETHNVTNNTWVTQMERQRTTEEIRLAHEKEFRNIVREAYEDGLISYDERERLWRKERELGIDPEAAKQIYQEEKTFSLRRVRDRALDEDEYNLIKVTQSCIRANDKDGLLELFDDLKGLNARIDNGQVQFFYYMLYAALYPGEFVKEAETPSVSVDCFWRTAWLSMAFRMRGIRRPFVLENKFRQYLTEKNAQFPGNVPLVSCLDNLKESLTTRVKAMGEIRRNSALTKYKEFEPDHQSFLNELGNALSAILSDEAYPLESQFYLESFFPEVVRVHSYRQELRKMEEEIFLPLKEIPAMPKTNLLPSEVQ